MMSSAEYKQKEAETEAYLRLRARVRFQQTQDRFYALSELEGFFDQGSLEQAWEDVVVDEADRIRTRRSGHDE
jgi:hypothetical protein